MTRQTLSISSLAFALVVGSAGAVSAQETGAGDPCAPEPVEEPAAEPADDPTAEPVDDPTAEPVDDPTAEPADDPTAEPADDPTAASVDASATVDASAELETPAAVEMSVAADTTQPPLVIGARFGGIFPGVFSELGTHVTFGLEAGYRLPFADQRVEVTLGAGYAPPGRDYTVDPYELEVSQQELHFSLGPRVRLLAPGSQLQVTAAIGFRLFLLRTTSNGNRDAEPFAEFTEDSTRAGFYAAGGAEYRLGPGAAFFDLELGYSSLPHKITGDVSTGNLAAVVGYRLFLL